MAIVDKTHSQTIEEAFNSVAEGSSGGGGSGLVVNITSSPSQSQGWVVFSFDKTYAEIAQALDNGIMPIVIMEDDPGNPIKTIIRITQYGYIIMNEDPEYLVGIDYDGGTNFSCASVDGYPSFELNIG